MSSAANPGDGAPARPGRRLRWFVIGGALLLVLAWAAAAASSLARADRRLRQGIAAAEAVKADLSVDELTTGAAAPALTGATRDFDAAHKDVSSVWLAPFSVLPVIGTQLHSVADLSHAAATVTDAGGETLTTTRRLMTAPHATPAERTTLARGLAAAIADLDGRVQGLSLGPSRGLISALASKRATFATDLSEVRTAVAKAQGATAAIADLLTGPRTYLVIAANNAEMRSGAGMALQVGTLSAHDGTFTLGHFVPTSQLVATASPVAASGDLAARWGFEHPTLDFRDLLLSPQFPANAALAAQMWQARTGQAVDGVLLLDTAGLQDLMTATGPVTAGGQTLSAGDVLPYLLVQQYAGLTDQANEAREEQLGLLASVAFAAISRPGTSLPGLASALMQAADGRHVLAWSGDAAVERDWAAAGVGGSVGGDDLLLAVLNQGANKLDPYQQVAAHLTTKAAADSTDVTVAVTVTNDTPASVTGYAAGGSNGLPPRQYTGAVALDFPAYAGRATADGVTTFEASGRDYGADVLAVPIAIPPGQSTTVTFRFVLAGVHGRLDVLASARIPPTTWTAAGGAPSGSRRFTDAVSHTVSW